MISSMTFPFMDMDDMEFRLWIREGWDLIPSRSSFCTLELDYRIFAAFSFVAVFQNASLNLTLLSSYSSRRDTPSGMTASGYHQMH